MIKLLRIDHRLLHGQVAFSWSKQLGTDCILLACDTLLNDKLRMSAIKMAKPSGVKVVLKQLMMRLQQSNLVLQISTNCLS